MGLIDESLSLPRRPGDPDDVATPRDGPTQDLTARRLEARRMGMTAWGIFIAALALAAWFVMSGQVGVASLIAASGTALAVGCGYVFTVKALIIPADLTQSIAAAAAFDLSAVTAAHRAHLGLSDAEAARHEQAFRRWAALATLTVTGTTHWPLRDGPFMAYRAALAAQPALYEAFCDALPGGHKTLDVQWIPYAGAGMEYGHLWLAYGFAFGEPPDPAIWPPATYSQLAKRQSEVAAHCPGLGMDAAVRALLWRLPAVTD